jgi:hypothetical protein
MSAAANSSFKGSEINARLKLKVVKSKKIRLLMYA